MKMLEEPKWQDNDGDHVEFESEAYGCKVTSTITLSSMVLLGNEFGDNIDITDDEHIGGQKFLCEKSCVAKIKATRKTKHFIFIGLTNLLGEPILLHCNSCRKITCFFNIRSGVDLYKDIVVDESDGENTFA